MPISSDSCYVLISVEPIKVRFVSIAKPTQLVNKLFLDHEGTLDHVTFRPVSSEDFWVTSCGGKSRFSYIQNSQELIQLELITGMKSWIPWKRNWISDQPSAPWCTDWASLTVMQRKFYLLVMRTSTLAAIKLIVPFGPDTFQHF